MQALFVAEADNRFAATDLTRGPWDAGAQHAGPPAALLGRALERCAPRDGFQIARVTLEILRPVPITTLQTSASVVRPGRSVELLAASLHADGTEVVRASAWRIRTEDIGVAAVADVAAPAGPETVAPAAPFPWSAAVGYHTVMEWRFVAGAFTQPGPATVWLRMRHPLVAGERPSPLVRVLVAADSGNGVSAMLDFATHRFVNPDLTVYLHRPLEGEWVCLDAVTTVERHGIGLADTRLSDTRGPVGRGVQSLFVGARG